MMVVCPSCSLEYDDLYRFTFCPHRGFAMRTAAYRTVEGELVHFVATSVEVLDAFSRAETLADVVAMGGTVVKLGGRVAVTDEMLGLVEVDGRAYARRPRSWFDRLAVRLARWRVRRG